MKFSNGQKLTGLSFAEHPSKCVSPGDSGGAFWLKVLSTDSEAVGIISGDNNQGALTTNCRSYCAPIAAVVSDFGGGLA